MACWLPFGCKYLIRISASNWIVLSLEWHANYVNARRAKRFAKENRSSLTHFTLLIEIGCTCKAYTVTSVTTNAQQLQWTMIDIHPDQCSADSSQLKQPVALLRTENWYAFGWCCDESDEFWCTRRVFIHSSMAFVNRLRSYTSLRNSSANNHTAHYQGQTITATEPLYIQIRCRNWFPQDKMNVIDLFGKNFSAFLLQTFLVLDFLVWRVRSSLNTILQTMFCLFVARVFQNTHVDIKFESFLVK